MPNRLATASSPYLRQHAENPVDWYPWGEEALGAARRLDRPILLSVGYSACHWCHVMAHESFENAATAALMNDLYVNIKVDREERPDIDHVYMEAVQLLTGQGGWPMTVFLLPDGRPFYGGTYFPPTERHGLPAFNRVLATLANAYRDQREAVLDQASSLAERLGRTIPLATDGEIDPAWLVLAGERLVDQMDAVHGGLRGAPKFPQPMMLEFLLRQWRHRGDDTARALVELSLRAMADGGIHDQIGGGFARYATDGHWLVPHFEKMLYDNAQLARVYLDAYRALHVPRYRTVVESTLDYVLAEMTSPDGAFYAAQDADSEGEEGRFYVWQPAELVQVLGAERGHLVAEILGITEQGNFDGASIPSHLEPLSAVARHLGRNEEDLAAVLAEARPLLYAARSQRVRPGRDEKVIAAWNGMMLRTFAEASLVLDRPDYLRAAVRNAHAILANLRRPDGRLYRSRLGEQLGPVGFLDDHANVADGLLALYAVTGTPSYLAHARELLDIVLAQFADDEQGGFYDTAVDGETLVTRPRNVFDNAVPAGTSVAAEVLWRLAGITGEQRYLDRALDVVAGLGATAAEHPTAFGRLLCAMDCLAAPPTEIVLVGGDDAPGMAPLRAALAGSYHPAAVVARLPVPGETDEPTLPTLVRGRRLVEGSATVYVCHRFACRQPARTADELLAALAENRDG